MDDSHLRSGGKHPEISSSPTFRQSLGPDPAASHLLGPNIAVDGNVHSSIQYNSLRVDDDIALDSSSGEFPVEKRPSYHKYESVDTLDKSAPKSAAPVLWKGTPARALIWELFGVVISVLFLVLGACVAQLKGQEESEWSKRVLQATRIAPSIWPILFSGILGNAVRRFANWRAERGIRLLALEQLMSSLTMAGSVLAILTWSIFQFSSLVLVVLWAFNPLGSQASFRGTYLTDSIGHDVGKITYYNYNLSTQTGLSRLDIGTSTRTKPMIRALYSAALYGIVSNIQYVDNENITFKNQIMSSGGPQAAGVQAATDSWGNLRIPNIEYLNDYDTSEPYKWIQVPWMDQMQNYSSLVGDRFDGLDRNFIGNTTFNITSSYQNLNCSPWVKLDDDQSDLWAMQTYGQNFTALLTVDLSKTYQTPETNARYRSFLGLSAPQSPYTNLSAPGHPPFVFVSRSVDYVSVTNCTTGTTYVDAQVTCMSRGASGKANCGVDAIRKSLEPTEPPGAGFLEALRVDDHAAAGRYIESKARGFLVAFTDILDDNQVGSGQESIVERYLADPMTAFDGAVTFSYANLGDVDIKLVERRLSLLYNTLWKVGWSYKFMTGGEMITEYESVVEPLGETVHTLINVTSQIVKPLPPVYTLDVPWLVVYFVSVGVMFSAAIVSLVLHAKCQAPPILGYVSSLTRDSVFFGDSDVPGNSTEGGESRAKRLGKTYIRIADVWGGESVGRVAFAPAQGRSAVKKGRWYM